MKPAIHWWSNSPHAPTGYGTQTKAVAHRLANAGFPTSIGANYGAETVGIDDRTKAGKPCPIYPRGFDSYSQDTIVAHWRDWSRKHKDRPCHLVTLYDSWVLKNPELLTQDMGRIFSWTPIDHITVPKDVAAWCARPQVTAVAMSKHGQEALAKRDIDCVYIPHTVEKVFVPTDGGGRLMQVPDDHFVVMMNAANKGVAPTRKAFTENLLAMSAFMKAHDDVSLYLHTELHMSGGINLPELIEYCGLPKDRIHAPNAYAYRMGGYTDSDLAAMYSRADVLLAVSMGEGFGIPTIEAQACGTRVIGSNAAATPELLADDCWAVEGQPEWNPMQSAFWFRPHIRPIVDALEEAYNAPRGPSQKCIEKAKEYAAETVVKRDWFPMLEAA